MLTLLGSLVAPRHIFTHKLGVARPTGQKAELGAKENVDSSILVDVMSSILRATNPPGNEYGSY